MLGKLHSILEKVKQAGKQQGWYFDDLIVNGKRKKIGVCQHPQNGVWDLYGKYTLSSISNRAAC